MSTVLTSWQRELCARIIADNKGHVTGGEPYGYENVHYRGGQEVPRGESHDYVGRRVKLDEAEVIRAVFRMYAAGWGFIKIAKAMNGVPQYAAENREYFRGCRVPPPPRRTGSWSPRAVQEMLRRRRYRGEIVWGKTTHTDKHGRAGVRLERPEKGWIALSAPDLRIVDDQLWEAVEKRLKARQEDYLRDTRGKLWGKPDIRREGQYLLSGLAKCALCGWNIAVLGGKRRVYGCTHALERGVCSNDVSRPVDLVDAAFLEKLKQEVLTPEGFRYALECGVADVIEKLAEDPDRGSALEREKVALSRKIERMVAAIGDGNGPSALVREIAKAEARVSEIDAQLVRLAAGPGLKTLAWKIHERKELNH
jgi:hypothetical protein